MITKTRRIFLVSSEELCLTFHVLYLMSMIYPDAGRVVNVASVAGRFCAPLMAAYNASKYAVEGFNDALR